MEIFLIRHGETEGNKHKRYVGMTDEPLCDAGLLKAQQKAAENTYPLCDRVYVSPLTRARQTASILFPAAEQIVVDDLREMDFGDFEGRNAEELSADPAYQAWVHADCATTCPGGEEGAVFERRTHQAFCKLVEDALAQNAERLVIVSHGGVGMNLMAHFARPKHPFYEWWLPNCSGYRVTVDRDVWEHESIFSTWNALEGADWHNRGYSFFQNTSCEYFPCHPTADPQSFNCLFCFCPLYTLSEQCGGDPAYTDAGVKDCSGCLLPHRKDSYGTIMERLQS